MNSVTPASYIHALRPVRSPPQGVSGAVGLQKRVELRARQDGLRLLEGLDLLVTGGLAVVKILKHKIACRVELGLGGGEVLQFGLRFLQRRLGLGLLGLRLRLLLGLIVDGLVRINDRRVRFLDEVLVRRLRVLLRFDRLGLHHLGVVDDLLDQAHHARRVLVLLVRLEPRRRRGPDRLLPVLEQRGLLGVEALEHLKRGHEQLLRRALVRHSELELLVLDLSVLARTFHLDLHLSDLRLELLELLGPRVDESRQVVNLRLELGLRAFVLLDRRRVRVELSDAEVFVLDLVRFLLQEKADEIKHKDFCIAELNTNTAAIEKNERAKAELETKIDNLKTLIDTRTKEIDALKAQIAEMQVQMKRAGEDREIENKEFQLTVADQRATQKLLVAALEVLKGFYAKKAALLQHGQEPVGPPPPSGFEAYKKNENAPGVMGLIEEIINDAKVMEAEAIKAEEDAQTAYEDFVKETNTAIVYAHKAIDDKTKEKAQAETEKAEAEATLEETEAELENLAASKAELHAACDFVLKNFDYRQTARDQEIEALKQAKAILSGAKFNALLQSYGV